MTERQMKIGIILYRIGSRAYFHLPFMTIYFSHLGYDIRIISFIMAIYGGAVLLYSMIPEKYRIVYYCSSKMTLILSELIKIFGLFLFFMSNNLLVIGTAQLLLGISFGVPAGSDSKIIYTSIKDTSFQGRSSSYMFLSLLLSALIGSLLFQKDIRLPFLFSLFAAVFTILICLLFLPEDRGIREGEKVSNHKKLELSVETKQTILTYAFSRGMLLAFFNGFLSYYLVNELHFSMNLLIMVLSAYTIAGNLSANIIGKMLKDKNKIQGFNFVFNLFFPIIILLYFSKYYFIILINTILLGIMMGLSRPICITKIKDSQDFTYIIERMEKIYSIINLFVLLIGGLFYHRYSINGVLILMSFFYCIYIFIEIKNVDVS